MKYAIVDIGSNSMRLSVYEAYKSNFRILFREKIMAGLAGYVEKGILTKEGIECAVLALSQFKETLDSLNIKNISVFATASLRNIENTEQAISALNRATGYSVEVISGEEEAMYAYYGAMHLNRVCDGIIVDIGGASTEIVTVKGGEAERAESHRVGSLSLYRECVKKILPKGEAFTLMDDEIAKNFADGNLPQLSEGSTVVCVGGTARAALKIATKLFSLEENSNKITSAQFKKMCNMLFKADKNAVNIILKYEPDRIHTLIPGFMILKHIIKKTRAEQIYVCKYGVREGYLCQKFLKKEQSSTPTPKTENSAG